jgi:hypothetical protein
VWKAWKAIKPMGIQACAMGVPILEEELKRSKNPK